MFQNSPPWLILVHFWFILSSFLFASMALLFQGINMIDRFRQLLIHFFSRKIIFYFAF